MHKDTATQAPLELYQANGAIVLAAILKGAALPIGPKRLSSTPKIMYSQQRNIGGMVYMRIEEGGVQRGGREAGKGGAPVATDEGA